MIAKVIHEGGKTYTLSVTQVVLYTNDGHPIALSYEQGNVIVHGDITKDDFSRQCGDLGIVKMKVLDA